mgnify:FL=1
MTSREAYVFGWVFGRLSRAAFPEQIGGDVALAAPRPYTANARIISDAQRAGLLKGELDRQIGEALCEIRSIVAPMEGGSEKYQPLEIQGAWQMGYYAGKGGRPLPPEEMDIAAARRAKGMTQAQLAEAMGVDQAVISRWEAGKVHPNEDNVRRLNEVLA